MPSVQDFRDGLTDDSLRLAIAVGLATVPITLLLSWGAVTDDIEVFGGSVPFWTLVLAGLYVGYRYGDRPTSSRRAGFWTGLAASLGTTLLYVADTATTIRSVSPEWAIVTVVATPFVIVLGAGITAVITMLTAQFADWATTRLARDRRTGEPADTGATETVLESRWWLPVAAYAFLAPIVLGYVLWLEPDSGVGILVSVLGLLVLVPLSVVALVGLFIDATAPRGADVGWLPNVWAYVGGPLGVYALAYLAAVALSLDYPPGYGIYSFFGALWIAAAVYIAYRQRHVGFVRAKEGQFTSHDGSGGSE